MNVHFWGGLKQQRPTRLLKMMTVRQPFLLVLFLGSHVSCFMFERDIHRKPCKIIYGSWQPKF